MEQINNICLPCFATLRLLNLPSAYLWKDLVFSTTEDDPIVFIDGTELSPSGWAKFDYDLQVLEVRGFLVSQEYPGQGWLVEVNGITPDSSIVCKSCHA